MRGRGYCLQGTRFGRSSGGRPLALGARIVPAETAGTNQASRACATPLQTTPPTSHDISQGFFSEECAVWQKDLSSGKYADFLTAMNATLIARSISRSVYRFSWRGRDYFFKWHTAPVKNGLGLREWEWMQRLAAMGIPVANVAAAGESFFVSEGIRDAVSVEQFAEGLGAHCRLPAAMVDQAVGIVSKLHASRIAHKDLYLGHFFWQRVEERLTLIDLARVQQHRLFFLRWRIKDLASLYFSSSLLNVHARDRIRFFHVYLGRSKLRFWDCAMLLCIMGKARRIARHTAKALSRGAELRQATPHNLLERVNNVQI